MSSSLAMQRVCLYFSCRGACSSESEHGAPPSGHLYSYNYDAPSLWCLFVYSRVCCVFHAKPISTDEALDSLSAGFVSAPPPSAPKKTELVSIEKQRGCHKSLYCIHSLITYTKRWRRHFDTQICLHENSFLDLFVVRHDRTRAVFDVMRRCAGRLPGDIKASRERDTRDTLMSCNLLFVARNGIKTHNTVNVFNNQKKDTHNKPCVSTSICNKFYI